MAQNQKTRIHRDEFVDWPQIHISGWGLGLLFLLCAILILFLHDKELQNLRTRIAGVCLALEASLFSYMYATLGYGYGRFVRKLMIMEMVMNVPNVSMEKIESQYVRLKCSLCRRALVAVLGVVPWIAIATLFLAFSYIDYEDSEASLALEITVMIFFVGILARVLHDAMVFARRIVARIESLEKLMGKRDDD